MDRNNTSLRRRGRRAGGFSLVELMVGVSVMAVLGGIAAPSFSRLVASQRVKSIGGELHTALVRARSEAIKRNTNVTLVPVTAGQWQYGWSITHPTLANTKLDDHGAIASAVVSGPDSVIYQGNGRLRGSTAPSFDISATGMSEHRCVQIDLSGRPYQKASAC